MTRPIPIAPMMADMVRNGIAALDGKVFANLDRCPHCGGGVRPHDLRLKRFATIRTNDDTRDVHVRVKRFRCARCGRLCYADSPFYPGTRHGAPIVELAAVLSERMPPGRTARTLERLGIVLDCATVRSYAGLSLPPITTTQLFGIPVPTSILHLSSSLPPTAGARPSRPAAPAEQGNKRQKKDHEEERNAESEEDRAQSQ
jgi:ribosomal protein S27AE